MKTFKECLERIRVCLAEEDLEGVRRELTWVGEIGGFSKEFIMIDIILQIYSREREYDYHPTVLDYSRDMDILLSHFIRLKLLLRRLDFDLPKECQEEIYEYCRQTRVSNIFLMWLVNSNMFNPKKVAERLSSIFIEAEGENSYRGILFREVVGQMEECKDGRGKL